MKALSKILLTLLLTTSCLNQQKLSKTPHNEKGHPIGVVGIGDVALTSETYILKSDSTKNKKKVRIIYEHLKIIRVPASEKKQDSLFREMFDTIIIDKAKKVIIKKDSVN